MRLLLLIAMMLFLQACSEPQTGPIDVKWDRNACDRCQMMLSDRKYSAQVRVFPEGKRSKSFLFDDIGCASIWLAEDKQKKYQADSKTEIWVNDMESGLWIDAKTAWYVKDQITPMNYGLGATPNKIPDAIPFEQAREHIAEVEQTTNAHGLHSQH